MPKKFFDFCARPFHRMAAPSRSSARSRVWCFTVNNPDRTTIGSWYVLAATWTFYQYEIGGETGTPHLQGCCRFANAKTLVGAKEAIGNTAHLEIAQGTIGDNVRYCSKDDTRAPGDSSGPFEFGLIRPLASEMFDYPLINEKWLFNAMFR